MTVIYYSLICRIARGFSIGEIIVVLLFYFLLLTISECFAIIYSRKKSLKSEELDLDVGRWVGKSENIIILTLMLLEAYTALGLIFAAKGLIRWEQIKRQPNYYVMGTLVNFACSIAVGGVLLWIVKNEYYHFGFLVGLLGLIVSLILYYILKHTPYHKG